MADPLGDLFTQEQKKEDTTATPKSVSSPQSAGGPVSPQSVNADAKHDLDVVSDAEGPKSPTSPTSGHDAVDADEDLKEEEPKETPYSIWEAERRKVLEARRTAAEQKKTALAAEGAAALENFYKERAEKIAKCKDNAKVDEEQFLTDMKAVMEHGSVWEKVAKLCDLKPKPGETPDSARFRQLLVQLKHDKSTQIDTTKDAKEPAASPAPTPAQ